MMRVQNSSLERNNQSHSYSSRFSKFQTKEPPYFKKTVLNRFSDSNIFYDIQTKYSLLGAQFISPFKEPKWANSSNTQKKQHKCSLASLRNPIDIEYGKDVPGPGTYTPSLKSTKSKRCGLIKSTSRRFDDASTFVPGPGSYFVTSKGLLSNKGVMINKQGYPEQRLQRTWRINWIRKAH